MLSSEDLVELGTELRAAGFKVATYQYFSAQQLSLHLAANGMSDRRRLATYLGPIFCTNAAEQRRFAGLFDDWLARRFPGTVPAIERSGPVSPAPAKLGYSRLHWKLVIAVAALLLAGAVGWALWQMQQPREIRGVVETAGNQPIADATVEFEDQKLSTAADGSFRIQTTTRALPARLKVSKEGFDNAENVVAGEEYAQLRGRLYLWPRLPDLQLVEVQLKAQVAERPKVAIEFPPTRLREPARIGEPQVIDLNQVVPPAKLWQRLIWRDVALTVAPLLLFGLWQILAWLRRPALQRLASKTPRTVREVHLPGGVSAPTAALPLRRLAQELRRRRAVHSAELQVRATIDASLRNAGMFTPVRGSRVEPDYLALVDIASQSDHQARLEDELVRHLLRSDVLIERYVFQGDPTLCTNVTTVRIEELHARCPEHRLLVFTDGARLFDPFTGALTPAAEVLLQWSMPTILTSKPLEQWSEIEWALDRRGFNVLPISRAGLTALMSSSIGAPADRFHGTSVPARVPSYERHTRRLLERDPPAEADIERLCKDLREDFGERGFAWIAGCAAYPEIHWGITLRLGAALVPQVAEQEMLLPRLARLVWFREAYIPDWLRKALLEHLSPVDEATTRALLHAVLASLTGAPGQDVPLRIALSSPPATGRLDRLRNSVRDFLYRWRVWRRSERVIHSAPPDSPLRDYVFLRFISGSSIGKLSLSAPGTLLKLLFRGGSPLLGFQPAMALLIVLTATTAIGVVVRPVNDGIEQLNIPQAAVLNDGTVVAVYGRGIQDSQASASNVIAAGMVRAYADGRPARLMPINLDGVKDGRFSPDGRWLAVYRSNQLQILDTDSGAVRLSPPTACVSVDGCLAFSSDGSVLAFVGSGSDVMLPRLDNDQEMIPILNISEDGAIRSLALDSTGSRVATSTANGIAEWKVGETADDELFKLENRWTASSNRLVYAGDGRLLAIGLAEQEGIWDVRANRLIASLPEPVSPGTQFALSGDKPLLAALDDSPTNAWFALADLANGTSLEKLFTPPERKYAGLALSRNGSTLAATAGDGTLSIWSIPADFPSAPQPGRSFALVVASDYAGSTDRLRNAVSDARAVTKLLRDRFGFGVTLLENEAVTQASVLGALEQFRELLEPQDRLLIVLIGYGTQSRSGQFQFATSIGDANDIQVVSSERLAADMRDMTAKAVLVVVDSSYARLFANAATVQNPQAPGRSRELIVSYTEGMPSDGPPNGNSPFIAALLQVLASTNDPISAQKLTAEIDRRMRSMDDGKQVPSYTRLNEGGDSGAGSFEFPTPLTPAVVSREQRATDKAPTPRTPAAPQLSSVTQSPVQQQANDPPQEDSATQTDKSDGARPRIRTLDDDVTLQVPAGITFPWQRAGGEPVTRMFVIRNDGPYLWYLTSRDEGESQETFAARGCEVLRARNECEWSVTFQPGRAGRYDARLLISGSVERPQGTLSARIQPIELHALVRDPPWRLQISSDAPLARIAGGLANWDVPTIVVETGPALKGTARIQLRNPLERPVRLALQQQKLDGDVIAATRIVKDSCAGQQLEPYGRCEILLEYAFDPNRGRPTAQTNVGPIYKSAQDVFTYYEQGESETEPVLRDRAVIIVSRGSSDAKTN